MKHKRSLLLMFILSFCISFSMSEVDAGVAWGSESYFGPYCGLNYSNFAYISTGASGACAYTSINSSSGAIPTGYVGAKARLFKDGALFAESTTSYNSSNQATGFVANTSKYTSSGNYYSSGRTEVWNGYSYIGYFTYSSPYQTQN